MCDCFQLEPEPDYRYWKYCENCGSELKRGYLWEQGELKVYKYDPITRKPTYTWYIQCPAYEYKYNEHTVKYIQTTEINEIKLLTMEEYAVLMNIPEEGRPEMLTYMSADEVLLGVDGNAFAVMGAVTRALKKAGATKEYIDAYRNEAMSGDYDHLLAASVEYLEA